MLHRRGLRTWHDGVNTISRSTTLGSTRERKARGLSRGRKQTKTCLAACRERFAQLSLTYQKKVRIRSPLGLFWGMDNPAECVDSRDNISAIASGHGIVVIEGDHIWESSRASIKVNDSVHFHGNRNESTALARQWQPHIEVVEHAAMMLCHSGIWDTIMNLSPCIGYSTGAPVVFYADMTMTIFGITVVAPGPLLKRQRFNLNSL